MAVEGRWRESLNVSLCRARDNTKQDAICGDTEDWWVVQREVRLSKEHCHFMSVSHGANAGVICVCVAAANAEVT